MKPKLKELIFASFDFEDYNPLYIKILMLHAIVFITLLINTTFFVINLTITHTVRLAGINLFIAILMLYVLYLLQKKGDHIKAGYVGTAVLFVAFNALAIVEKGVHFTLIWTYFFIPFAMITLQAKKGFIVSLLYLSLLFALTYSGVGVWQHGYWDMAGYTRFVLAHIVMLYVMYAIFHGYEQANLKIAQLRQHEQDQLKVFEKLSVTDPLTGLYNRRFMEEIFPKQRYSAMRNNKRFAFFLLDIDHFKIYNDSYGHQRGDEALISIAEIMKKTYRRSENYIFRIGGDEFAGILMANDTNYIQQNIEKLRESLISLGTENRNSPVKPFLTYSIGVHILGEDEIDFKEVYRRADTALYQAKAEGRNRVVYL